MSGFIFSTGDSDFPWLQPVRLEALAGALARRGTEVELSHTEGAAAIGTHHPWERDLGSGWPVHRDGHLLVAADASLYYRDALFERSLVDTSQGSVMSSAASIASAYRTAGRGLLDGLEGDFAFALWDGRSRRLLAARDPFGCRSLFWTELGGGIVLSSLLAPLREVAGKPELDRTDLLRAMLIQHGEGTTTPWRGIREVPAGWLLEWQPGRPPVTRRYWYPTTRPEWERGSTAEGGRLLAGLLRDAARERLARGNRATAIGMSGGRDSTAIVGSLLGLEPDEVGPDRLKVLSFAYPEGDPGNEDRYVRSIQARMGLDITWLDTDAIPIIERSGVGGAPRTRPEPQPFEGQNRALAAAARDAGAPVLLNGNGGDNLFGLSDSWLADLLRTGRMVHLVQELRHKGYRRARDLRDVVVRPAVPLVLMDWIERVRGRRILSRPWEAHAPPWVPTGAFDAAGIVEEDRAAYARDIASRVASVTDRFRMWAFLYSGFSRNCASLFDMSLDEGVELRMPFYDTRVADFAWSRPPNDLNDRREHKVILRHAMTGILPDDVIAPRRRRTGTSDGYFERTAQREFGTFARGLLGENRLADLGLVDPRALSTAVDDWIAGRRDHELLLFTTVCVEWWIRVSERTPWSALPVAGRGTLATAH